MKGALVVLALLTGCLDSKWEDVPGAKVTPVAEPPHQDGWAVTVQTAVDTWAAVLRDYGCPAPFVMAEDGHPIRFVYDETGDNGIQWGAGLGGPGPSIEIRARDVDNVTLVLHELGHALGLGHADAAFGGSLMVPKIFPGTVLTSRDIEAAACELGCGPCTGPDPYDD
jgi:hypothetical protein